MVPFFGDVLLFRVVLSTHTVHDNMMTYMITLSYSMYLWYTTCSICIALNLVYIYIYNSIKHRKEIRTSKIKRVKHSQCPLPKSLNHGSAVHPSMGSSHHRIAQRCQLPPPCVVRAPPRTLGDAHLGRNQAPGNHRSYRIHALNGFLFSTLLPISFKLLPVAN